MALRIYKAESIVLKRRNIGETDRIITIFTKEYGKLRVLAKGVRRITSHRSPHLEVFSHVILYIHQGNIMDYLSEASTLESFAVLRANLDRVSVAYYLCDLVDNLLPEKQEHRDVFNLLSGALQDLNTVELKKYYTVSEQFSQRILHYLGFAAHDNKLRVSESQQFIERILEKHLRTPKILRQMV